MDDERVPMTETAHNFYQSYASYKNYVTPVVGQKQVRRYDQMIWNPAACQPAMKFLEIGCGTGEFLAYLAAKGCDQFWGIDHDSHLAAIIPQTVSQHFVCGDLWQILTDPQQDQPDRVVALDVLEHFSADEALRLLTAIKAKLAPKGRLVVKVPNASCPWGLQYQFGDLTHRTAFTPLSLHQLADAAGFKTISILPHRQGSRRRLITDALVHRFLSWALATPPQIWSANFVAVFEKL
jgi:cyclopropane fatty-acyl-phospholipid synthase-like methyltransferase